MRWRRTRRGGTTALLPPLLVSLTHSSSLSELPKGLLLADAQLRQANVTPPWLFSVKQVALLPARPWPCAKTSPPCQSSAQRRCHGVATGSENAEGAVCRLAVLRLQTRVHNQCPVLCTPHKAEDGLETACHNSALSRRAGE